MEPTAAPNRPDDSALGERIKVRVAFTDSDGFTEGPLTSDATANPVGESTSQLVAGDAYAIHGLEIQTGWPVGDEYQNFIAWWWPSAIASDLNRLAGYEVETRLLRTTSSYDTPGPWEQLAVPAPEKTERYHGRHKLQVEPPADCRVQEWRVRALYDNPPRHSGWVSVTKTRLDPPTPPHRPETDRQNSTLAKTGDDSYSLTFRWHASPPWCWPNTGYEVGRRDFQGYYYGTGEPEDGEELHGSRNIRFDSNTMTKEGNLVWSNWASVATTGDRSHAHSFNGNINYQFRVRAENVSGWSSWSRPLLFSVSLSPWNDQVVLLPLDD